MLEWFVGETEWVVIDALLGTEYIYIFIFFFVTFFGVPLRHSLDGPITKKKGGGVSLNHCGKPFFRASQIGFYLYFRRS